MLVSVDTLFYDRLSAPVTLVFGDDAGRRAMLARAVASEGGRIAGHVAIAEAVARLEAQAVAHVAIVDAVEDSTALDAVIARITQGDGIAALVLLAPALIERAGALIGRARTELLVAADEAEIGAALARLFAMPGGGVAEADGEAQRHRLGALSEEVARIARALAALSVDGHVAGVTAPAVGLAEEIGFLRGQIRLRGLRERFFDAALFADPAWDMLLDLRLAALEGRRVSVSSLCIAARVPPTTALRWIVAMTQRGLLVRIADPADGRRVFVALGHEADSAMARFCDAAATG